jgi:hypothetical protein
MPISETGHVKNAANFNELIAVCTGFGAQYNPANAAISLASLNTKYTEANTSLSNLSEGIPLLINAVNEREIKFADLSPKTTQIINALAASEGVSEQVIKDAKTFARKIQGKRGSAPKTDDPNTPEDESLENISASQMSYDNRVASLFSLIELLKLQPGYTPNETELTTVSLDAYHQELAAANTAVINASVPVKNLRIARDNVLYEDETGLCDLAKKVKSYIKSVYKASSPEYKLVSGIEFKKRKI